MKINKKNYWRELINWLNHFPKYYVVYRQDILVLFKDDKNITETTLDNYRNLLTNLNYLEKDLKKSGKYYINDKIPYDLSLNSAKELCYGNWLNSEYLNANIYESNKIKFVLNNKNLVIKGKIDLTNKKIITLSPIDELDTEYNFNEIKKFKPLTV